ncbi:MAG TPA: protein-glutamate O-methyltransferase CheR [Anaerolineae bacterium]|nr:protein-glutamate O-methyltransferase CheR [Anaerolineae bacterium]
MHAADLETIEIDLFLNALYQRYGYDFRQYAQASIRRRIKHFQARTHYKRISDLIPAVLYDEAFAHSAIHDFSIMVTEMFRDPTFYNAVREKALPYLKTFPFIKIWHAGCATGEEVYSLAIVLQEEGLYDRATIFATDFNDSALQTAREGIYALKEIRQYTKNYQQAGGTRSFADYYHAQYESAIMEQSLKKNVTFANHNLVTDGVFSEVHLIFCRNVLIYFDKTLQNRVLNLFADSLSYGGFLCLGSKETLRFSDVQERFKVIDDHEKIYQKCTT